MQDILLFTLSLNISSSEIQKFEEKLNRFSDLTELKNILLLFNNEKKKNYLINNIKKDFYAEIIDINGLLLDAILYHVQNLIPQINLNAYVNYDKEYSHYVITSNKNAIKLLNVEFWNTLNEFDYECVIFISKEIDRELRVNSEHMEIVIVNG